MANLKLIQPSEGYKQNLRDYLLAYNSMKENQNKLMLTWNNLFLKLMFAMEKANPAVDLTALTREQIYVDDLPCKTVKNAIEAGFLPAVDCFQRFTREI